MPGSAHHTCTTDVLHICFQGGHSKNIHIDCPLSALGVRAFDLQIVFTKLALRRFQVSIDSVWVQVLYFELYPELLGHRIVVYMCI